MQQRCQCNRCEPFAFSSITQKLLQNSYLLIAHSDNNDLHTGQQTQGELHVYVLRSDQLLLQQREHIEAGCSGAASDTVLQHGAILNMETLHSLCLLPSTPLPHLVPSAPFPSLSSAHPVSHFFPSLSLSDTPFSSKYHAHSFPSSPPTLFLLPSTPFPRNSLPSRHFPFLSPHPSLP